MTTLTNPFRRRRHPRPTEGTEPDAPALRRVRWRLLLWSGGSTLVLLVALGVTLAVVTADSLRRSSEQQLADRAAQISTLVLTQLPSGFPNFPIGPAFGGPESGTVAIVIAADGAVHGLGTLPNGLPISDAVDAARRSGSDMRTTEVAGVPVRIFTKVISGAPSGSVVQIVADITNEVRTVTTLISILVVGGLIMIAGSLVLGWLYAKRALVPIRNSLRRQRDFAADASHERPVGFLQCRSDGYRGPGIPAAAHPGQGAGLDG